VTQTLK